MKKLNSLIFKDAKNQRGLTNDEMAALWAESGLFDDPMLGTKKEDPAVAMMDDTGFCLAENTKDHVEPYQCAHDGKCHQCHEDLRQGKINLTADQMVQNLLMGREANYGHPDSVMTDDYTDTL